MDLSAFEGKRILITGASGLIGRALVSSLLSANTENPATVIALVRTEEKARKIFSHLPDKNLEYCVCDICDLKPQNLKADYIIHGASRTSSKDFVDEPVETVTSSIIGTKNILEFARCNSVKSFVYLSSMEVYGTPLTEDKIYENSASNLNTMSARSSYPEGKRLCECLCASYSKEYGVPVKVARLTQTFGEGVDYYDGRVFAQFARSVIEGKDIVLKTKGETKRNYVYVGDAVSAIFKILLDGGDCEAYNVANEETYCSIYEMATAVVKEFGKGKCRVIIDETDSAEKLGYAPTLKMNLDTTKLKKLGWKPEVNLMQMYSIMIDYMKKSKI